ncbi:MAG: hypothetical protein ACK56F_12830, partial [bacterium]
MSNHRIRSRLLAIYHCSLGSSNLLPLMNISRDAQDCRVADSACRKRMSTGQIVCGCNFGVVA